MLSATDAVAATARLPLEGKDLAKRFVELHGGRVWLESEVGRGSTFSFSLSLVAREEVAR